MLKTLAEHTSLVNVPTRDAISAWNGGACAELTIHKNPRRQ